MSSTAIMSLLGFGFWLFVAHVYALRDIGFASALISVTILISNFSLLGLNAGLVRFLPESKNRSGDINAALVAVGGAAMVGTLTYLIIDHLLGSHTAGFFRAPQTWPIFMLMMAAVALNTLTDAVFIARRRAEYHTLVYATFGVVRLILPFLLITSGAWGIFMAYIGSVLVSLTLSFYLMWRKCDYHFLTRPRWRLIPETQRYAFNNYLAVILGGLPSQLLPSMILGALGAPAAAFFSMSWTMANLIYVIPSALSNSLLAESSNNPREQDRHLSHAMKIMALVLVPAIGLAILVAPFLLEMFGHQYAVGSTAIFQIMAVTGLVIGINTVAATILNIEKRSHGIAVAQAVMAAVSLILAAGLMRFGLVGVGLAMVGGHLAASAVFVVIFWRRKRDRKPRPETIGSLIPLLDQYGISNYCAKNLTPGSSNQTYLITTQQTKYILRVYKPGPKLEQKIIQELNFIDYLAEHGVPVVPAMVNRAGRRVSTITVEGQEMSFIVMQYVAGTHLAKVTPAIARAMARTQAQIHVMGQAYAANAQAPKLNLRQRMVRNILLLSFLPQGVSHFDYDVTNVLVKDDKLRAVLDFEGMRKDALIVCLMFSLRSMFVSQADRSLEQVYLDEYEKVRQLGTLERIYVRLWGLRPRSRA